MKKYYKVTMTKKFKLVDEDYFTINGKYIVNNIDELKKNIEEIARNEGRTVDDYEITYEESTIEEFIKSEEDTLKRSLINKYIDRHDDKYGNLTVRQYNQLRRCLDDDLYFEILREEKRIERLDSLIRRRVDVNKITLSEYDDLLKALLQVNSKEEFDELIKKYEAK